MKRDRYYADIPIEEEEERRTRKMKRYRYDVDIHVPMDLMVDILSRLPARCVWRLRSVCKDWKSHIESPHFADLHFRRSNNKEEDKVFMFWGDEHKSKHGYRRTRFYSIDFKYGKADEVVEEFLHPTDAKTSSVNGLVCYYGIDGEIKICNPLTRQLINLPKPSFLLSSKLSTTTTSDDLDIGLGFDSASNTYKVLAFHRRDHLLHPKVEILTLGGTLCWRRLKFPSPTIYIKPSQGVYANGCAFWFTSKYSDIQYGVGQDVLRALMTFNFAKEMFEFVPFPPDIDIFRCDQAIREVGGHACLIQAKRSTKMVKLWTLAPNSGSKLWAPPQTLLLRSQKYPYEPDLFPVSSGVMEFHFHERTKRIFFYNEQGHIVKHIRVRDIPRRFCPLQLHTESLVSLRSILAANL